MEDEPRPAAAAGRRATRSLIALGTPSEACDQRARLQPDEVGLASADGGVQLTWGEVRRRSDGLAAGLLAHGASRQTCGVAFLPNGPDLFVARLAAEKAGLPLALVPVTFGAAEVAAICRQLRPAFAFVAPGHRPFDPAAVMAQASDGALRVLVPSEGAEGRPAGGGKPPDGGDGPGPVVLPLADLMSAAVPAAASAEDPFAASRLRPHEGLQLSATSGSTGMPKCVPNSAHSRGLTGCVQAERWEMGADDVIAALTPIVSGTADALAYHAAPRFARRIVLVQRFRAEEVLGIVERHGVTAMTAVPTMLARLAGLGLPPGAARRAGLRVVASHGAPLAEDLARAVEAVTGARIVQAFGTSDHGGVAASRLADPPEVRWRSAGRPLEGNEVELRGPDGRPVPPGEPGRVHVRGPHVFAAGADGRSEAQPWIALEDMARQDGEGNLWLLGRTDDVIIRGGQNIFPGDIEERLLRHPAVAEAAVVGLPDAEMGQRVCACVVPRAGAAVRGEDLVGFLRGTGIAPFKLPERVAVLPALPRSANGLKINRRALVDHILAGGAG